MNVPTVSVIVATRNRPAYLRDLLDSLSVSSYAPYEVVVVDDAGDADANARVIGTARGLAVRLEANKRIQGTVASLNRGAARARGEILAFTDDDCIVDPAWLARLIAHFVAPQVGGVGGRVIPIENDHVRPLSARQDLRIGRVDANGAVMSNFDLAGEEVLKVDHLSGANMSFRREIFEHLGGFDVNYAGNCYRFETDWGVRVRRAGFTLLFAPRATVSHRRASIGGNRIQAEEWFFWYARNHIYFLRKNFPELRVIPWRFALRFLARVARQEKLPAHLGACSRTRALVRAGWGVAAGFTVGASLSSRAQ